MISFNTVLFNDFEVLDAFGPVEIISKMPKSYKLDYYSFHGETVLSNQQISVNTRPFSEIDRSGILLIPGGIGTRKLINDTEFIEQIKALSHEALYVLTVCTGSALLAKTGLLENKNATTNKMAFDWVSGISKGVNWSKNARWVRDGKYYTSSGVSAGMDMTLGFISDIHNEKTANDLSKFIEYIWNKDKNNDLFAIT
ncbi:MAG: DJ-1/PfpI family protein [Oscillospiraceae bacterium]|nr:DJ-1/PfpI family protein [Oscillospiraceae bacterium]